MKELPANQPFQDSEEAPMHGVDSIPLPASLHFRGTAARATDVRPEMKSVRPGRELLNSATRAFENGGIAKLLEDTPMNSAQGFPTLKAVIHNCLCYSSTTRNLTRELRANSFFLVTFLAILRIFL
jgi:hypothetical protein